MDLNSLISKSPQLMTVLAAIKNDPNFLAEFKENPQAALQKIGVELNEEELKMVQNLKDLSELQIDVDSLSNKLKWFMRFVGKK